MRKISVIACILIVFSVNIGVSAQSVQQHNQIFQTQFDDNVPVWEKNDVWIYKIKQFTVDYLETGIRFYLHGTINDFKWKVSSTSGSEYVVDFTGKINAEYIVYYEASFPIYVKGSFTPSLTRLTGNIIFSQSDLEIKDISAQLRGLTMAVIEPLPIPIPLPYRLTLDADLSSPIPLIDFPIDEGHTWEFPEINAQLTAKMGGPIGLISFPVTFTSPLPSWAIKCMDKTTISVQGNSYLAYMIEPVLVTAFRVYYAPEVGNFVKIDASGPNGNGNVHAELISSTYSP